MANQLRRSGTGRRKSTRSESSKAKRLDEAREAAEPALADTGEFEHSRARTRKGTRTVQRILDAAEEAFVQHGYKAANLRDIASAAGIQQPGLYKHFESKAALYSAVLNRALQPLVDRLDSLKPLARTSDPIDLPAQALDVQALHPSATSLIYQALILKGDDTGREIIMGWLDLLRERGFELTQMMNPNLKKNEIMLIGLAMMNLNHGFFLTAPIMSRMFGKPELSTELAAMWKGVLHRVNDALINDPPPALPLASNNKTLEVPENTSVA
jgi:AcrR family transcriptional regulator